MRVKKGFTLAEILIVLMVIGVIATLTIPGLMRGVQEAQLKTGFKKGYNTIVNLMATAAIDGSLPAIRGRLGDMYTILVKNIAYKGFIQGDKAGIGTGAAIAYDGNIKQSISVNGRAYGDATEATNGGIEIKNGDTPTNPIWIVGEDNLAFAVVEPTTGLTATQTAASGAGIATAGTTGSCGTKVNINASSDPTNQACYVVVIDANGLNKTPNKIQGIDDTTEAQVFTAAAGGGGDNTDIATPQIVNDQFLVYVGRDGATAGNPSTTITGRLVGDVK